MKQLLALIAFVFIADQLHAQLYPGITAAYQFPGLQDDQGHSRGKTSNGFKLGGFVDYPLWKERFGIRLETSYSRITIDDPRSPDHLQLNYLSTPLSFFYTPNRQAQLFIGPQLNTLLKQKGPSLWGVPEAGNLDTFDYGIQASLEMFFAYKWSVAFRYYQGLKYNNRYQLVTVNNVTDVSANRFSSILLAVNYIIRNEIEKKKNK